MQTLITELTLVAVGWITDISLYPLYGCWPEQSRDGVRYGVLFC